MKLYHGSNVLIDHIDLSMSKPNKDFGKGFYLTDIREQALEMAYRRCRLSSSLFCTNKLPFLIINRL